MFYYLLPTAGVYGGVKKAFHAAEQISSVVPCVIATPGGDSPNWFKTDIEVISHMELEKRCCRNDTVLFSCPPDAEIVDQLPAETKVLHMQGADPMIFPLFDKARGYQIISQGLHMTEELLRYNRVAPYVPYGIPDLFRWKKGDGIQDKSVIVLSRKGGGYVDSVKAGLTYPSQIEVIGDPPYNEEMMAAALKRADVFVAISPHEWLGAPPMEAMAAGCAVVGFPGVGGFEFMKHSLTAHLVPNGNGSALTEAVTKVLDDFEYRAMLRKNAMEEMAYYTMEREQEALLRALKL